MVSEAGMDPALIGESHRLLNQARLIAEAPAAQTSALGHTHPQGQMPPGLHFSKSGALMASSPSTLQQFGDRINRAIGHDSDTELRAALHWCGAELKSLQHGAVAVPETRVEFHHRIVRDYEGVIAPTVAARERCSVTEVRAGRVKLGRTARLGVKVVGGTASPGEGNG